MFIREKRNKSGTLSVQLVSKASGSYRVVKTVGCGRSQAEIAGLLRKAKDLLPVLSGRLEMDFVLGDDAHFAKAVSDGVEGLQLLGPEMVLGKLFDEIGFGAVTMDPLLRLVVLSRLVFPLSKLKTTEYVARHSGLDIDVARIYRFMDKLDARLLKRIRLVSHTHSMKVLGVTPSVVFYDVTTLYFEAEQEDDLRKAGFSKDGKHQSPQILLGLLVGPGGYPLAYDIFEGNKFEGHTMLPVIEAFRKDYQLDKLVVVADAGLLSKENIDRVQAAGQEFNLGARIKNEGKAVKELVLALGLEDGQSAVVNKPDGTRLVVSYSEKRSRKDAHNRERGLGKLREMVAKGRLTKDHVSNRGYKKFLSIHGSATVNVDEGKVAEDARWDGLKGYITNSKLEKQDVIDNYRQLWAIEKAFRISKTDLRIRPIYHRLRRRIEAHVGIAFAAHKIYKELERQLKERNVPMSPERAIEVLKSIYGIRLRLPQTQQSRLILIDKAEEQQIILKAFGI